ncbi:alpha/beta hydrolase fold [Popillia japonica]|uniref:Alpha/beta hydrolase fold n=1 Tax=Popillia japonica TaxID=7064 RepID=A0AAW1K1W4_POPJA
MGKYDRNITTISIWDSLENRDNPPGCLVDTSIGQHKYVKLKKVKLHYVEAGNKDQPLMLFLHGFPDCWISWRYQVPFFAEYFRVVSLDLKGFGDSDKPVSRGQYNLETILEELEQFIVALGVSSCILVGHDIGNLETILEELEQFIVALGVSSCILVGHDIGALLGWFLTKQNPHLVEKFVSISCSHPNVSWNYLPSNGIHSSNWIKFVQCPGLPELDVMKNDLKIIKDYHQYLQEKYTQDKEILEAYKYTLSRKEDWSGPLNYFRTLPFHRIRGNDQIEVPTLLVTDYREHRSLPSPRGS